MYKFLELDVIRSYLVGWNLHFRTMFMKIRQFLASCIVVCSNICEIALFCARCGIIFNIMWHPLVRHYLHDTVPGYNWYCLNISQWCFVTDNFRIKYRYDYETSLQRKSSPWGMKNLSYTQLLKINQNLNKLMDCMYWREFYFVHAIYCLKSNYLTF